MPNAVGLSVPGQDLVRRSKTVYRVRNWQPVMTPAKRLQQGASRHLCGRTPQAVLAWYYQVVVTSGGAMYEDRDVAIQAGVDPAAWGHLPLRQAEGLRQTPCWLMAAGSEAMPDHTTLSRRQAGLAVKKTPPAGRRTDRLVKSIRPG